MQIVYPMMALIVCSSIAFAEDATTQADPFDVGVKQAYAENSEKYKNDAGAFVRPGLIADRKTQTVTITAKFTGVGAGDPVEFFLVGPDSGKDYESLAVSAAKASDVHAALEFIGMKPGQAVNYRENRNWPKGERVRVAFAWTAPADGAGPGALVQYTAEKMLVDSTTAKPPQAEGFMFVGSTRIPSRVPGGADTYSADVSESRSILSNYNEPGTVLDLPGQAVQGAVYGLRKVGRLARFKANQVLTVTLQPKPMQDGSLRVRELKLTVDAGANPGGDASAFQFNVIDESGKKLSEGSAAAAVAVFGPLVGAGHDVFVTVTPSDYMSLTKVRTIYALLNVAQGSHGIRIEPAPQGHLYWRAFFPQEDWRDPKTRLGEPWELHVRVDEKTGQPTALLRQFNYDAEQELKTHDFSVNNPDDLAKVLKENSGRWTDGVFVFAPDELQYGKLMTLIRPSLSVVNWWYVFPPTPAATAPVQMP